jgi:hypothetical protein
MRDISNSPIFLRLGARNRGPKETTKTGALRRVIISNVVVYNADPKYSSIISGIPGYLIEDVQLSNIRIYAKGGGTKEQAALEPPEREALYPEPTMFGELPAYGFFIRHVKGLQLRDVEVSYLSPDLRPAFWLNDVREVEFIHVKAQGVLLPDQRLERVEGRKSFRQRFTRCRQDLHVNPEKSCKSCLHLSEATGRLEDRLRSPAGSD